MPARSSGTMPDQSRCPMFEVMESIGRLSPSSADDVVAAAIVGPEVAVEALAQLLGLALEPLGERVVVHEAPGELGDAQLRVVDVALDLGGRDRQERDGAVGELDRRPTSPSSTGCRAPATTGCGTRRSRRRRGRRTGRSTRAPRATLVPPAANEVVVAGEAPVLRQQDQPERRRVGGAVVRAVRLLAEHRQLAAADLVQDLAGLLVAEVVDLASPGAPPSRCSAPPRQLGADPERLQRRDQRVPAEERHEPRQPGRRQDVVGSPRSSPVTRSAARSTTDCRKTLVSNALSASTLGMRSSQPLNGPSTG